MYKAERRSGGDSQSLELLVFKDGEQSAPDIYQLQLGSNILGSSSKESNVVVDLPEIEKKHAIIELVSDAKTDIISGSLQPLKSESGTYKKNKDGNFSALLSGKWTNIGEISKEQQFVFYLAKQYKSVIRAGNSSKSKGSSSVQALNKSFDGVKSSAKISFLSSIQSSQTNGQKEKLETNDDENSNFKELELGKDINGKMNEEEKIVNGEKENDLKVVVVAPKKDDQNDNTEKKNVEEKQEQSDKETLEIKTDEQKEKALETTPTKPKIFGKGFKPKSSPQNTSKTLNAKFKAPAILGANTLLNDTATLTKDQKVEGKQVNKSKETTNQKPEKNKKVNKSKASAAEKDISSVSDDEISNITAIESEAIAEKKKTTKNSKAEDHSMIIEEKDTKNEKPLIDKKKKVIEEKGNKLKKDTINDKRKSKEDDSSEMDIEKDGKKKPKREEESDKDAGEVETGVEKKVEETKSKVGGKEVKQNEELSKKNKIGSSKSGSSSIGIDKGDNKKKNSVSKLDVVVEKEVIIEKEKQKESTTKEQLKTKKGSVSQKTEKVIVSKEKPSKSEKLSKIEEKTIGESLKNQPKEEAKQNTKTDKKGLESKNLASKAREKKESKSKLVKKETERRNSIAKRKADSDVDEDDDDEYNIDKDDNFEEEEENNTKMNTSGNSSNTKNAKRKLRVMLSNCSLENTEIIERLEKLGVRIENGTNNKFDVLIMDSFARRAKALIALNRDVPIVNSSWAIDSICKESLIENYAQYAVPVDKGFMKNHHFDLATSKERQQKSTSPLLGDFKFILPLDAVYSSREDIEAIIVSAGGVILQEEEIQQSQESNAIVIFDKLKISEQSKTNSGKKSKKNNEEDQREALIAAWKKEGFRCVETEALFVTCLQQKVVDWDKFQL